ncbi:MAG: hypothetical protein ACK5Z5_02355 [Neisseriaceae bacterium]|jgi:HPr kinase/phosphorylase
MDNKDHIVNLHATAVNIYDYGVLITGDSGIGKSELALDLVARGHKFISDDSVSIKNTNNGLEISAQKDAIGYIHVRGLGFIHIDKMYNNVCSIMENSNLELIVELVNDNSLLNKELLSPLLDHLEILNTPIPRFKLPIGTNRNLAILSEIIVKYHHQLKNGYDSNKEFIQRMNKP